MNLDTHGYIIDRAVQILDREGHPTTAGMAKWGQPYLVMGARHADRAGPTLYVNVKLDIKMPPFIPDIPVHTWHYNVCNYASLNHYYNPNTQKGLDLSYCHSLSELVDMVLPLLGVTLGGGLLGAHVWFDPEVNLQKPYPSAAAECQQHYDRALRYWKDGKPTTPFSLDAWEWQDQLGQLENAMFQLGWACHMVADCCVSPHTVSNKFVGHDDYEALLTSTDANPLRLYQDAYNAEFMTDASPSDWAQWGLSVPPTGIAAEVALQTKKELSLYDSGQWEDGLRLALPRAERFTALLIAKFLIAVGVVDVVEIKKQVYPLLSICLTEPDESARVPGGYLFYRHAGERAWQSIRADEHGGLPLPAQAGDRFELRPAMPGYAFDGNYFGDAPCISEFPTSASPVLYTHMESASAPCLYLALGRTAPKAAMREMPKIRFVHGPLGPFHFSEGTSPEANPIVRQAVNTYIARQLEVVAMGEEWGSQTELAPGKEAYVRIARVMAVNPTTGDLIKSRAELATLLEKRPKPQASEPPAPKELPKQASGAVHDGVERLPTVQVSVAGILEPALTSPFVLTTGEPTGFGGLLAVPVPAGTPTVVEIARDWGCISYGAHDPIRLTVSADEFGCAWVHVKAGTQAGTLRLQIQPLPVQSISAEMVPPGEVVDLLVSPDPDGGKDVIPETPPTLEQLPWMHMHVPKAAPYWDLLTGREAIVEHR